MSEQQEVSTICSRCGGVVSIRYTIEFVECAPHSIRVDTEPRARHDGTLDKEGWYKVWRIQEGPSRGPTWIVIKDADGTVAMLPPSQALSLLVWLEQERATLEALAKEESDRP